MGNSRKLGELGIAIDSSATSTALTIDANENVGIGVTPEAWGTGFTSMQIGGLGAIWGNTSQAAGSGVLLSNNSYRDATNQKYIVTDEAAYYNQINGAHVFAVAPSGTADTAISWTNALTIDNSANATFGGEVTVGDTLNISNSTIPTWDTNFHLWSNTGVGGRIDAYHLQIDTGASRTTALAIDSSQNATFGGTITSHQQIINTGSASNVYTAMTNNGTTRWVTSITGAESTGNAGSDWTLSNYNDAGSQISSPLIVNRATGNATFGGYIKLGADVAAPTVNDEAYVGVNSSNGLQLIGQGSAFDVTIYNKSALAVLSVPTGTQNATFGGNVSLADGKALELGALAGGDLNINHSGASAFLTNYTGNYNIRSKVDSGLIYLATDNSVGTLKNGIIVGGATPYVRLYYDGSAVLNTTPDGFNVNNDANFALGFIATSPVIYMDAGDYFGYVRASNYFTFNPGGVESVRFDASVTAGQTRLLVYDVDNATTERVTVGAADSGGAGYKVLRIPN